MIVVTGGTGFVGREICRQLASEGLAVRALARTPPQQPLPAGVEFFPGDVTQPDTLRMAFRGAKAVVHTVGIIREHQLQTFNQIHVRGTAHIIAAAQAAGVPRYLHLSALGTRPGAASRYHQTKWAAEELVRSSGLAYTIFRPSLIYGKGDAFTNHLASLMRPPLTWLSGGFLPIPGGEDVILQPVAVGEVAEAVVRSLGQTLAVGQSFDLCGQPVSLKDLSLAIAHTMGRFPTWVEQPPDVILGMMPWLWLRASKPVLFPVPLKLCRMGAAVLERILPNPPLTTDQVTMLEEGQCGEAAPAENLFGFHPADLRQGLAAYLAPQAGGREDHRA